MGDEPIPGPMHGLPLRRLTACVRRGDRGLLPCSAGFGSLLVLWLAACLSIPADATQGVYVVPPPPASVFASHSVGPITRISDVRALSTERAAKALPVRLDAVVTFYQAAENMLYVQDDTGALYVRGLRPFNIHAGSRVIVIGVTAPSYRNVVWSSDVQAIGEAPLPTPRPASFSDLINGTIDCEYVSVKGLVRSSTVERQSGTPFLLLDLLVDGGPVSLHVLNFGSFDPDSLLDSEISFSAASGKIFDGKFGVVGVKLYMEDVSGIHVLSQSRVKPQDLPLSPFSGVYQKYVANNQGLRLRVRGAVTLYDPGELLVLDHDGQSLLVHTHQDEPVAIGQVVDVSGFADYNDYSPSLSNARFTATAESAHVTPQPITYAQAMTGQHSLNLVSLTGTLIAVVNEEQQETVILESGGHLFSAEYLSPQHLNSLELGSTLRVTGVCLVESYGPYHSPRSFTIRLPSPDAVTVLALPSWMTVKRLAVIAGLLLSVVIASLLWAEMLRRRVASQTEVMRLSSEEDAAWERRTVYLEKERSKVLEAINSSQPLAAVLELIASFIDKQIWGVTCSFRLTAPPAATEDSASLQLSAAADTPEAHVNRRSIQLQDGTTAAQMLLLTDGKWRSSAHIEEVLDIGCRLAALAIENRLLHEQLVRRSEYDQLTDVPNRFLIEGRLEHALEEARASGAHLAVIYVDLDEFKQVNDLYGHRVGDLYLQQTAQRLSAQLRDRDLIARIGGDEFLAIVHDISGRDEAEGVGRRLASSFAHPFTVEDIKIHGAASIGIAMFPEDGVDSEGLKRSADHAMYELKRQSKLISAVS